MCVRACARVCVNKVVCHGHRAAAAKSVEYVNARGHYPNTVLEGGGGVDAQECRI